MRFAVVLLLAVSITSVARATVLYQGNGSSSPADQGMLYVGGANTTNVTAGGVTTLDTTAASSDQSGWSATAAGMDHSGGGYVVSLDMKVLSQSTSNNDRAGISLIALSSDHLGVEIAFFTNEVWAYDFTPPSTFTHGEGHSFDTTAAMTTYDLAIHGTTYELFAGGNSILSGNLRDYSQRGFPYTVPSFVFLGDDTTESNGSFQFSRLEVNTPEPASAFCIAMLALLARRRSR